MKGLRSKRLEPLVSVMQICEHCLGKSRRQDAQVSTSALFLRFLHCRCRGRHGVDPPSGSAAWRGGGPESRHAARAQGAAAAAYFVEENWFVKPI